MRLSISNIAWEPYDQDLVIGAMGKWDVRGVEIAPTKIWTKPAETSQSTASEIRSEWEDLNIQVSSLQALLFGHPEFNLFGSEEDRDAMLEYLARIMRLGGALGAGPLVFGSPKNRLKLARTFEQALDVAVPFFRKAAIQAEGAGVTLCLEPNPPAYGCDFVTNTQEAIEVVRAVAHPSFRLHLDSGIMTMNEEDPEEWIPAGAELLEHFHCSEPQLAVIGTGGVDHARFSAALHSIGYEGWVAIEMRSGWSESNVDSVNFALEHASKHYV